LNSPRRSDDRIRPIKRPTRILNFTTLVSGPTERYYEFGRDLSSYIDFVIALARLTRNIGIDLRVACCMGMAWDNAARDANNGRRIVTSGLYAATGIYPGPSTTSLTGCKKACRVSPLASNSATIFFTSNGLHSLRTILSSADSLMSQVNHKPKPYHR